MEMTYTFANGKEVTVAVDDAGYLTKGEERAVELLKIALGATYGPEIVAARIVGGMDLTGWVRNSR